MPQIVDFYSESNRSGNAYINSYLGSSYVCIGQSFTGDGGTLSSAKFYVRNDSSITGDAYVTIYAEKHSTAFGTDSLPTGSVLATSNSVDISTVGGSVFELVEFTFTGAEKITLTNGNYYVCVLQGDNLSGNLDVGDDYNVPTHSGNGCVRMGTWQKVSNDLCFYVYKDDVETTTTSTSTSTSTSSSTSTSTSSTSYSSTTSSTSSTTTSNTSSSTSSTTSSTSTSTSSSSSSSSSTTSETSSSSSSTSTSTSSTSSSTSSSTTSNTSSSSSSTSTSTSTSTSSSSTSSSSSSSSSTTTPPITSTSSSSTSTSSTSTSTSSSSSSSSSSTTSNTSSSSSSTTSTSSSSSSTSSSTSSTSSSSSSTSSSSTSTSTSTSTSSSTSTSTSTSSTTTEPYFIVSSGKIITFYTKGKIIKTIEKGTTRGGGTLELSGYVYDEDTIEYGGDITYASPQTNSEKPTGGTTIKDTYRGVVSEEKPKGGKIITKS